MKFTKALNRDQKMMRCYNAYMERTSNGISQLYRAVEKIRDLLGYLDNIEYDLNIKIESLSDENSEK